MNGKQLLEAMSLVDEKYIEDAEAAPKRNRIHWQGFAAAACLAVVLAEVWSLNNQKETVELTAAQDAEIAAYGADTELSAMMNDAVSKRIFIPEMTVLVVKQEGNALHCQVEEPGTGSFEAGQEITVLLPDDFQDTLSGRLLVSFSPTHDARIVTALDWTQLED